MKRTGIDLSPSIAITFGNIGTIRADSDPEPCLRGHLHDGDAASIAVRPPLGNGPCAAAIAGHGDVADRSIGLPIITANGDADATIGKSDRKDARRFA